MFVLIEYSIKNAYSTTILWENDTILILGKGAERYIVSENIINFSDIEYVKSLNNKNE